MFNSFPYTNLHELNLDWIIETIENYKLVRSTSSVTTDGHGTVTTEIAADDYDLFYVYCDTDDTVILPYVNSGYYCFMVRDPDNWDPVINTDLELTVLFHAKITEES